MNDPDLETRLRAYREWLLEQETSLAPA